MEGEISEMNVLTICAVLLLVNIHCLVTEARYVKRVSGNDMEEILTFK